MIAKVSAVISEQLVTKNINLFDFFNSLWKKNKSSIQDKELIRIVEIFRIFVLTLDL